MFRVSTSLCAWLAITSICLAQDENAKQILARFEALRPTANELAMYRLDWAESIDAALERASQKGRPVLLIVIHAKYGDVVSGHC